MEYKHAKTGWIYTLKDDLRQRDIESWTAKIRKYRPKDVAQSDAEWYGTLLRGALAAGLVQADGLTPDSVGDLTAPHVAWIGRTLGKLYVEATVIPPE